MTNLQKLVNKQKQFIPCDCPKGGVYSDGQVCQKCGGTEYIEQKQSWKKRFEKMTPKYSEINAPSKTKWLGDNPDSHLFYNYTYPESQFELNKEKVKKFISQEIKKAYQKGVIDSVKELEELGYNKEAVKKAREEERNLIFDKIRKYQAGFVKDSGHGFICAPEFGVIDELIKIINK